jgi:hypothetical protein
MAKGKEKSPFGKLKKRRGSELKIKNEKLNLSSLWRSD